MGRAKPINGFPSRTAYKKAVSLALMRRNNPEKYRRLYGPHHDEIVENEAIHLASPRWSRMGLSSSLDADWRGDREANK